MPETIKTYGHLKGMSAQQLLALIGHAPEIIRIKQLDEKDKVFDRNDKTPKKDVFSIEVEKVKGKRLDKYFATEKNEKNVEEVAKQLGSILAFMHKNGLAHSDFRRTNILVEKKQEGVRVKVFDNETINIMGHDLELLRKKKLSLSGKKISYGSLKSKVNKKNMKVEIEDDFNREDWKKILEKTKPERKKKIIKTMTREYEREIFDSPMKFRGKEIHKMKKKSPFVRDLRREK